MSGNTKSGSAPPAQLPAALQQHYGLLWVLRAATSTERGSAVEISTGNRAGLQPPPQRGIHVMHYLLL